MPCTVGQVAVTQPRKFIVWILCIQWEGCKKLQPGMDNQRSPEIGKRYKNRESEREIQRGQTEVEQNNGIALLPRSIPHPHPISHNNYACCYERLSVKKRQKHHLWILLITKLLPSSPQVCRCPTVISVSQKWSGVRSLSHVGNEVSRLVRGDVRWKGERKRDVCVFSTECGVSPKIYSNLRGRETNPGLWGQEISSFSDLGKVAALFFSTGQCLVYSKTIPVSL